MGVYCVCWKDGDERGVVAGEENMDAWTEVEEVCSYFRDEQDGLDYYVGDIYANPLNPTEEEAKWSLDYCVKRGYISPAEYRMFEYFINKAIEDDNKQLTDEEWDAAEVKRKNEWLREMKELRGKSDDEV